MRSIQEFIFKRYILWLCIESYFTIKRLPRHLNTLESVSFVVVMVMADERCSACTFAIVPGAWRLLLIGYIYNKIVCYRAIGCLHSRLNCTDWIYILVEWIFSRGFGMIMTEWGGNVLMNRSFLISVIGTTLHDRHSHKRPRVSEYWHWNMVKSSIILHWFSRTFIR